MRQAAGMEGIRDQRVKEIVEEAMREAALERLELGDDALHRELLRLRMVKRDLQAIMLAECPTCGGTAGDCPDCRGSGFRHSVAERLKAMDRMLAAMHVEDELIGPARRAAAGGWPPLRGLRTRFRNALGETTREDFDTIVDAYVTADDQDVVARAIDNKPTRFPALAEEIRRTFRSRGLLEAEEQSAPEVQTSSPASRETSDERRSEPQSPQDGAAAVSERELRPSRG